MSFPTLDLFSNGNSRKYVIISWSPNRGTPLGCPLSWGEHVWCLYSIFISFRRGNIISIYLGTITLRSHGPMHNSGHLEYRESTCQLPTPHFFSTFVVLLYSVSYASLSFILKLKLNSWVPEYLSTWVLEYSA